MKRLSCDVLVIGGGATGTGLARDLAMRGLKTILVERRDLCYGTTGRFHGLLHSGGRYVVKDPQAARECYQENLILRRIMPHCIEDTGGFFVLTPEDDPAYAPRFLAGCRDAGIPVEELNHRQMLAEEPLLNPDISRCFRVPDGSADSFMAAELNALSARLHGAVVSTYHEVIKLIREGTRICGALCHDLIHDEQVHITADLVVNATGAWAGKIADSAGITIQMLPGKGTMLAVSHRIVHTVINRCKMPSDGDILVPAHTVSVMGTTDIKVSDPDHYGIEPWELRLILDEGEKLIPGFQSYRILRAWAGVRPLFQETVNTSDDRDVTRAYVLLDHAPRDGIDGLLTITSGKWTTYRKMAEVTADKVCEKLGIQRDCRTHLEVLPSKHQSRISSSPSHKPHYHQLGIRLANIEKEKTYGQLVCECELVSQSDMQQALLQENIHTLDDLRRNLRLGMGPCQGSFCTLRAAGLYYNLRHPPLSDMNTSLRDFLEERWKGQLPVLWGQQLRQARLNLYIYQVVLNAGKLPGVTKTTLAAEKYEPTAPQPGFPLQITPPKHNSHVRSCAPRLTHQPDVIVIGAGLAGLLAGWYTLQRKKKVQIITKGWGALYWGSGCIDLTQKLPLESFILNQPNHPYAIAGLQAIKRAVNDFKELCAELGYPMHGSTQSNWSLPTALGTIRQTCLAPVTMIAGDMSNKSPVLIVGFDQFLDFYPELIASNISAQGIPATGITFVPNSIKRRHIVSGMVLARLFDTPEFRAEIAELIRPHIGSSARIGFPAVLGLLNPLGVKHDLEHQLGVPVFEIPGLPPSIPGIRLHNLLYKQITKQGAQVMNGMQVVGCDITSKHINFILTEAAARYKSHAATHYILATGGILGGGIHLDAQGFAQDTALGIPIHLPPQSTSWHHREFLADTPHPLHCIGLHVNPSLQPLDEQDDVLYTNLFAIGNTLGGFDPMHEHSLEGIALTTGAMIGDLLS